MRLTRMRREKRLVASPLLRPPLHVVASVGIDLELLRHAGLLEHRNERLDRRSRIQRILAAVDDVQGTVHEVADIQLPVGTRVGVGNHQRMAIERHACRPRRRLTHREEVDAGAAVGDAGDVGARLVDVVVAFDARDQVRDVLHLTRVPPLRQRPRAGMQHDLASALNAVGQWSRGRITGAGCFSTDAAVQAHAQRPGACRVVLRRHLDDVVEGVAVVLRGHLDAPGLLFRVGPAGFEPRTNLVEARARRCDLFGRLLCAPVVVVLPKRAHRGVELRARRQRLCIQGQRAGHCQSRYTQEAFHGRHSTLRLRRGPRRDRLDRIKRLFDTLVLSLMKRLLRLIPLLVVIGVAYGAWWYTSRPPTSLTLTGVVTTNHIVVSPQITGRISQLMAQEGDAVKAGQLIAVLSPDELREERAFYSFSAAGAGSQVAESEAALRLQERQSADQIAQAEATLASTESQVAATQAELENSKIVFERTQRMAKEGVEAAQALDTARTNYDVNKSRLAARLKQIEAQKAAVALARSSAEQVTMRRSQVVSNRQQQAAAAAQKARADVRLAYTEIHAPIDGLVDVRAALPGEVVNPGQPVVTLINPDDLWVRIDVEETYIDRVRNGDKLIVRLPSGAELEGTVFYRAADAGFATQRDVSRTKRDIKTFEVRLRLDNKDRRLAVGMTAYVMLPLI